MNQYPRIAKFKKALDFRNYLDSLNIFLPFDEQIQAAPDGPLAQPYVLSNGRKIGNRFCAQPMEGWDGTHDGLPSEYTLRRWKNFGRSGAKLIWGGEATAVRHDGRANPNQLLIEERTLPALGELRTALINCHHEIHGSSDDLLVGLQLTHSGRFSRPDDIHCLQPKILYHHPVLDPMFHIPADMPVLTDAEIEDLIADFVRSAKQAQKLGFDFVDIKHCHGYLGHEFLSASSRPGAYGGSFENRTRFLREIVAGIRADAPGLSIGVRLSIFDLLPFSPGPDRVGQPVEYRDENGQYPYAFGADPSDPLKIDLTEPFAFLNLLEQLNVELVNLSAGSPYYNHHLQRPAYFPPSDGYQLFEDPLVGVARLVNVIAQAKAAFPKLAIVGTGYSYLQEWLPNVAQYVVRAGMADFIGLGRMILSYPDMPADILHGHPLDRKHICRTFSDCTTAPRRGLVSGCYPLDGFYKDLPEANLLREFKKASK
jgi:2,4-dienoyl-CoA reductase-like NADH-dependent reductase (Old Yellow Enzyme family)